ncbi:putative bifunctional diguanylate cyclase/phosphodiesterase [Undibacterium terreum]|uniref:Diguanylate cyclase (GGDEF) domain-containing protein n=1 Tax=Undibacterium terreum TaxID=1224302 RepID=A0A916U818_9BURK|nr:EAL domain-containing protein [Undibacterium terreum]GGC63183.1 hypothetical protein GCM10011396_07660 [Undibacterium terreum]
MKKRRSDGEFGHDPVKPGVTHKRRGSASVAVKNGHSRQGRSLISNAKNLLLREELVAEREAAVEVREKRLSTLEDEHSDNDGHLLRLRQANSHLVIATIEAHKLTEEVQAAKSKLHHLAHHDVLTDLPNRMLLQDRIGQAIELAHRQGRKLAVMFMDLDRFKNINDSLGHAVGDQLLQSVAQCLMTCVRHSDTVSRQGGDEFLLLLPFIEQAEDAALSAQKILTALALPHHIGGCDLHISVSIGISIYPDDADDAESLVKNADTAMYYAKEKGRNNYQFFSADMNVRAVERQLIETSLRAALQGGQFVLHYQPKVNLDSGVITGAEALLRWIHPEWGMVYPARFMPVAEDCGLIVPIGRWVLREACEQAKRWIDAGLPPLSIAVNISALEFRQSDFFEEVRTILDDIGLDASVLELEITESVLMRDTESSAAILNNLKNMGVQLAVDDFGTGYSSLSYLKKFPIDVLKIDKSFVDDIASGNDASAIAGAVVGMGNNLKLKVIAEGVESKLQLDFLQRQHCEEGQGFLFSRPVAAEEFAKLLQAHGSKKS